MFVFEDLAALIVGGHTLDGPPHEQARHVVDGRAIDQRLKKIRTGGEHRERDDYRKPRFVRPREQEQRAEHVKVGRRLG